MNKAAIRGSVRLYHFILKFYPKSYREEFGEEMEYVFLQSLKDAYTEKEEQGIVTLWIRTIIDTGKSLVTEHLENQKGGDSRKTKSTNNIMQNKDITSVFIVTVALLMIPLVAMQFTREVNWSLFDFAVIGTLLIGTGLLVVLASRKIKKTSHRVAVIGALLLALLLTWIHLAVGIVDSLPFAGS